MRFEKNRIDVPGGNMRAQVLLLLFICGCPKVEAYTYAQIETSRQTAKQNAIINAKDYLSVNRIANASIYADTDSTIDNFCPNGDGWASVKITDEAATVTIVLKCSTVSESLGCFPVDEFNSKVYKDEESICAPINRVPFPLPKLNVQIHR